MAGLVKAQKLDNDDEDRMMNPIHFLALFFIFCVLALREQQRVSGGIVDTLLFSVFLALVAVLIFKPKQRKVSGESVFLAACYNLGRLARRFLRTTRDRIK